MTSRVLALSCAALLWAWPASAQTPDPAVEPQTRAEALRLQREEKARTVTPPEPSAMERWLLRLEDGRVFERVLNPAEGFYPKIGNITPGSGFAGGPGYRRPGVLGGHADVSGFATVSLMRYWMLEGRLRFPHIARDRVAVDVYGQRSDFPQERFYGTGPDSLRENESVYGIGNTAVGGVVAVRARPWLTFTGNTELLRPRVRGTDDELSIEDRFTDVQAPGLAAQPIFLRSGAGAEVNYRQPQGNPRRGGRYAVTWQQFDDRDGGQYSFDRVDIDLQQYVPLLHDRRVLAFHAYGSLSEHDGGGAVPFYFHRTLGGPDDLRGFRRFRFRDENVLLLQAEYRWEIFTAVDGAIFYDAGTVAPTRDALSLRRMDSDYGIGFRFGTKNGVFMRVEGAFGSREGKHFVLRYGHVF